MTMKDDIDGNRLSDLWYLMIIVDDDDNYNKCWIMIW